MKIMVAVPCRDKCDAFFTRSLVNLARVGEVHFEFEIGTLVYNARNKLCGKAVAMESDYVLWIDDDMVFDETLLFDLLRDMREGVDMVAPICYMRKPPYAPVIYKRLERPTETEPKVVQLYDEGYPEHGPFEVDACGFGRFHVHPGFEGGRVVILGQFYDGLHGVGGRFLFFLLAGVGGSGSGSGWPCLRLACRPRRQGGKSPVHGEDAADADDCGGGKGGGDDFRIAVSHIAHDDSLLALLLASCF
jgi:hypothetical protein